MRLPQVSRALLQAQMAEAVAEGARLREELAASAARCDAAEANADAISQVHAVRAHFSSYHCTVLCGSVACPGAALAGLTSHPQLQELQYPRHCKPADPYLGMSAVDTGSKRAKHPTNFWQTEL